MFFRFLILKFSRFLSFAKGQIKPKADWRAVDSPKKQRTNLVFFAERQKQICSFVFLENLQRANLLTVLSDLYQFSQSSWKKLEKKLKKFISLEFIGTPLRAQNMTNIRGEGDSPPPGPSRVTSLYKNTKLHPIFDYSIYLSLKFNWYIVYT